jgi:parallel beta-helix repeat protein
MEPGMYNFTVAFYPRSGVRIFCKPGAKLVFDGGEQEAVRFNTNVAAAIVEGCDISGGWDGVKDTGKNNIIRGNYVHNNKYQGILCAGCNGSLMRGNKIGNNGISCTRPEWGGNSPRHCHDIYISNPGGYCANMTGIKIIDNILGPSGGLGLSVRGQDCTSHWIDGILIEGNEFVDNAAGLSLFYRTRNSVVRNNSFTIQSPPPSNMVESLKYAITVWGGAANEPAMTGNTYKLKAGYGEFKRY